MELRFYVDDGDQYDLIVASMLEEYGFKGIFYIATMNTAVNVMTAEHIKRLSEQHEIGSHTLSHPLLTKLTPEHQVAEILSGKEELEEIIGKPVTKFAYPRGWFNEEVISSVRTCRIKEARTMKQGTTDAVKFNGNMTVSVSVHFHPDKFHLWREKYYEAKRKGDKGYFGVTCHGWELKKYNLFGEYKEMLKQIYEDQSS